MLHDGSPAPGTPFGSHVPVAGALVFQRRRRSMADGRAIIGGLLLCLLSSAAFGQDPEQPTTAEGWYKRAYDRRHNKELDGAIADAGEAIKLSPKTGKYWLERGISRGNKGDLEGAL